MLPYSPDAAAADAAYAFGCGALTSNYLFIYALARFLFMSSGRKSVFWLHRKVQLTLRVIVTEMWDIRFNVSRPADLWSSFFIPSFTGAVC